LRQEIGLQDAAAISSVEIVWPVPGPAQTVGGLQLDSRYRIREGQPAVLAGGRPDQPKARAAE